MIDGDDGYDTAYYGSAQAAVNVSLAIVGAQNTLGDGTDVLRGVEALSGSVHNDTLTGDAGSNSLYGDDGDDTLFGGAGNDSYPAVKAVIFSAAVRVTMPSSCRGASTLA